MRAASTSCSRAPPQARSSARTALGTGACALLLDGFSITPHISNPASTAVSTASWNGALGSHACMHAVVLCIHAQAWVVMHTQLGSSMGTCACMCEYRYYENNTLAYGRKRWVVYKDTFNYNPTTVSPEWHGWLNYINDNTPHNYAFSKPIYQVPAYLTKTGTVDAYQPKGAWWNPQKRNWKKVETWQPPAKSS